MPHPFRVRTDVQTRGRRVSGNVASPTVFFYRLEREARTRLTPLLNRLAFVSRQEVTRLALRIDRLERRFGNRDSSAAPRGGSPPASKPGRTDWTGDGALAAEIEHVLQRLAAHEQHILRKRFGLGDGPHEVPAVRGSERRIEARALRKLWVSSSSGESQAI